MKPGVTPTHQRLNEFPKSFDYMLLSDALPMIGGKIFNKGYCFPKKKAI